MWLLWGWVVMFVLDFSCIWLRQIKVRFVTIIQVVYIVILILDFLLFFVWTCREF